MISRELLTLASRGLGFPKPDALRLREYRPQSYPTVRVRVLRPFYGLRRALEVGELVALLEPDALDAIALGRAERI